MTGKRFRQSARSGKFQPIQGPADNETVRFCANGFATTK
ncbi:hypothetical protein ACUXQ2_002960 [Cupriavidus metallidurans]